jgi:electron transfer flavoprotein alpha subunit
MKKVFIVTQLQSEHDVDTALQLAQLSQLLADNITVIVTYAANNILVKNLVKSSVINEILQLEMTQDACVTSTAKNICDIIGSQKFILLVANNLYGQSILPSCAAMLNCLYIENVNKIDASLHSIVNKQGLNASCDLPEFSYAMTIATSCFAHIPVEFGNVAITKIVPGNTGLKKLSQVVAVVNNGHDIILVGGRALGSRANFNRLEKLASLMNADLGATAGAVTAGYASDDILVGVSGSSVTDKIYIGFGVSGAISHTLALADAKTIIAINRDSNAAILAVADYAVIIDVMTAIEYFENIFVN